MKYPTQKLLKKVFFSLFCITLCMSASSFAKSDYRNRDDVQVFAQQFAKNHGKEYERIMQTLSKGIYQQSIIDAISKPAERVLTSLFMMLSIARR